MVYILFLVVLVLYFNNLKVFGSSSPQSALYRPSVRMCINLLIFMSCIDFLKRPISPGRPVGNMLPGRHCKITAGIDLYLLVKGGHRVIIDGSSGVNLLAKCCSADGQAERTRRGR